MSPNLGYRLSQPRLVLLFLLFGVLVHLDHLVFVEVVEAVQELIQEIEVPIRIVRKQTATATDLAAIIVLDAHVDATALFLHFVENGKRLGQNFFKWAPIFRAPEPLAEVDQEGIGVFVEINEQLF